MGASFKIVLAKFIGRRFKHRITGCTINKSSKVDGWATQSPDTRTIVDCTVKADDWPAGFIGIKRNYAGEAVVAALRNRCVQLSAGIVQAPCLVVCRNKLSRRHGRLAICEIQNVQAPVAGNDEHSRLGRVNYRRIVQRKRTKPITAFRARLICRKIPLPGQSSCLGIHRKYVVGATRDNDQIVHAVFEFNPVYHQRRGETGQNERFIGNDRLPFQAELDTFEGENACSSAANPDRCGSWP